jgi:hypothetical protein
MHTNLLIEFYLDTNFDVLSNFMYITCIFYITVQIDSSLYNLLYK